jgi:hypothetical protein
MDIRKIKRKLLDAAPEFIRTEVLRKSLEISQQIPKGIYVKLAETRRELDEVFNLVNNAFDNRDGNNLESQIERKSRITAFQMFPNSSIVIVVWYGRVVGTMTHILDTKIGLPMEESQDLSSLREGGRVLGEISAIAIDKSISKKDVILFLMTRFLFEYTTKHFNVDTWVMMANRRNEHFYRSILCFKPLELLVPNGVVEKSFSVATNFPQYLDLKKFESNLCKVYKNKRTRQNLYDFFCSYDFSSEFRIPDLKYYKAWTKLYHPKLIEEFFIKRADSINRLSPEAMTTFLDFYVKPEKLSEFDEIRKYVFYNRMNVPRYQVNCRAFMVSIDEVSITEAKVQNVSKTGFMTSSLVNVIKEHEYSFFIEISPSKRVAVTAKACWVNPKRGQTGFNIVDVVGKDWDDFMSWLKVSSANFEQLDDLK